MTVRDEQNRVTGMLHGKCQRIYAQRARRKADPEAAGKDAPTAYGAAQKFGSERRDLSEQEKALDERRAVIAEERAKEAPPRREDDWRDPIEADVDDMLGTGDVIRLDDI